MSIYISTKRLQLITVQPTLSMLLPPLKRINGTVVSYARISAQTSNISMLFVCISVV